MATRNFSRGPALAALAVAAAGLTAPARAADTNRACALVTPAELESVLGESVTLEPQGKMEGGALCMGSAPKASVLLRVAKKREGLDDAAKAGVETMRKKGVQVDVRTFGSVTCSTMVPPDSLAAYGFNTTCSITKGKSVAAVEITAKKKADQVSIERLKPLAEKMADRF